MRFARWRWGGTLTAYLFVSLAIGLAVAGCALAFGTAPASWAAGGTAPTPTATCPGPGCQTLPVALVVRGVVRPLEQSAVGSLTGGTVRLSRIVVGDRVLIQIEDGEERSKVGLYLPATAVDSQAVQGGTIIATGPGMALPAVEEHLDEPWRITGSRDTKHVPMQARVGDYALFF
ncbi:MAG: co-chaperone GroES, partial [Proteobacteria bacterium]|nr:co-chaperone GroES [Pseudomonadota bacterium]